MRRILVTFQPVISPKYTIQRRCFPFCWFSRSGHISEDSHEGEQDPAVDLLGFRNDLNSLPRDFSCKRIQEYNRAVKWLHGPTEFWNLIVCIAMKNFDITSSVRVRQSHQFVGCSCVLFYEDQLIEGLLINAQSDHRGSAAELVKLGILVHKFSI